MAGSDRTRRNVLAGVGSVLAGAGAVRAAGSAVALDGSEARIADGSENAVVEFEDQTATETVTVGRIRLPSGGFVAIRRDAASGPVLGVSRYFVAGALVDDVEVTLEEPLAEPTELVAVLHRDTDLDREFDYRDTDGDEDGPYTDAGDPVSDAATVSPPDWTPEPTPRRTATTSPTPGGGADDADALGSSTPVLGIGAAALFLGGAVAGALGWRRFGDGADPDRGEAVGGARDGRLDRNAGGPDAGKSGPDAGRSGPDGGGPDAPDGTDETPSGQGDQEPVDDRASDATASGREVVGPTAWGLKREPTPGRPVGRGHGPPREIPGSPDLAIEYDDLRIRELLWRDERGDVYRATVGENEVVVREPRYEGQLGEDARDRFVRGAEQWASLGDHDNVVGLVDWGTEPTPWLAMESMDAGDLADRGEGVPLTQATWIAASVADAVWHAHQADVLHLDLRPSNVLFRWAGEDAWAVPKVSDWGAGRSLLEHSRAVGGPSPAYAAPEQVDPGRYGTPNHATDVYQVGAVCYELFTGHPPFAGEVSDVLFGVIEDDPVPPTSLAGGLPYELDEILLGALAKRRANRYESMAYLRDDLWDLYDSVRGRR